MADGPTFFDVAETYGMGGEYFGRLAADTDIISDMIFVEVEEEIPDASI